MDSLVKHRTETLSLAARGLRSTQELLSNLSLRRTIASAQDSRADSSAQNEQALEHEVLEELRHIIELRNDCLSPTARLNDDTLCQIFLYYIQPDWSIRDEIIHEYRPELNYIQLDRLIRDEIIHEYRPESMTLRLSHVCRRWRKLTICTPSLWSEIPLALWYSHDLFRTKPSSISTTPFSEIFRVVGDPYASLLLQRAQRSMLSISITLRQPRLSCPTAPVSARLTPLKERIVSLKLHLPDVCTLTMLRPTISVNLCTLQRLTIFSKHEHPRDEAHYGQLLWKILETPFQCLRHLAMSCLAPLPYTGDGLPTHAHCETLELRLNPLVDGSFHRHHTIILATLQCFPNLKKLGIGIVTERRRRELVEGGEGGSVEPVTLSRLHALSLEVAGPHLLPIIRALHAPSTKELHILTKFPRGPRTPTTFASGSPQLSTSPADREPRRTLKSFVARCAHLTHVELIGIPGEVVPELLDGQNQIQAFACMAVGLTEDAWNKLLGALLPTQNPDLLDLHFYNVFLETAEKSLLTWLEDPSRRTRIRSLDFQSLPGAGYQAGSSADLEHLMSREVDKLVISQHRVYPDWTREKCPPGNIFPTSFELSFGVDSEFYEKGNGFAIICPTPFHD
ncbi:hypothetical protein CALVIDRAFT_301747 [Calocera viscosa TUFC12733]|uniref:Uncharacterized protein n=1 Tax=Calocera viscosa (strain TUFC12733) TaxID=1330018 RepID=A0A167IJZ0_CALVF|nr:hypothetical protein CALVIDRAFT_301747 [Calocera viscosa TUFC12733]